jgi:hypothetical protein
VLWVRNPGHSWFSRHSELTLHWASAGAALVGVGWVIYAILQRSGYEDFVLAALWMLIAASWFFSARQRRRRKQRGYGQVLPVPAPEVLILVEQGRKIRAIKRYRELNPDIGLKEAKDVIEGL